MVKVLSTSVMAAVLMFGGQAHAGGVGGDLIEGLCGGCGAGKALDRLNKDLGHPAEKLGAGIIEAYGPPGSGAAMHKLWMRNAGAGRPDEAHPVNRGFRPPMGNRCATRYEVSFPGPVNPIGSPCYLNGIPGRVVR